MFFKSSILAYFFALASFIAVYYFQSSGPVPQLFSNRVLNTGTRSPHKRRLPYLFNLILCFCCLQFLDSCLFDTCTVLPLTFKPLPLGSIRPTRNSWLEHELLNSANGLAGHLWDFYAFVKDSTWLGGDPSRGEYSKLHEGFPYWFNGLVGLAYSLPEEDVEGGNINNGVTEKLKAQVHDAAQRVLASQAEDGWLGPETLDSGQRMLWGRFPFLLGLTALAEANETWEIQIMPVLWRFVILANDMLEDGGKGFVHQGPDDLLTAQSYSYGRVRVADFILTLQWMLERKRSEEQELMLWNCMEMAYSLSLKWEAWYNEAVYIKEDLYRVPSEFTEAHRPYEHGVNIAQGLKTPAAIYRFNYNESLLQTSSDAVDWTFKYHGAASGTILADERIDGLSPWTGSELCTTVEVIFSLVYLYHALGENENADRAEMTAFNALPSMLTADHWAHQYMTQPNQPWSKNLSTSPFFDTNSQSQTFGLEPHYPCCTVNHPQGLPKFLVGSWVGVEDNGVAHVLLSPGTVRFDGVTIECRTKYPFSENLEYIIDAEKSFLLYLRVPGWALTYLINVDGHESFMTSESKPSTGLHRITIDAGRTKILYELEARIRIEPRANDTIAVYRGSLLYALEVKYESQSTCAKVYTNQSCYPDSYAPEEVRDYVLTNASAWNIAVDPSTIDFRRKGEMDLPDPIWAAGAPPTYMTAQGCEVEWPLFKDAVPGAPIPLNQRRCLQPSVTVRLVPLGSAKLHMAEIPTIDLKRVNHQ